MNRVENTLTRVQILVLTLTIDFMGKVVDTTRAIAVYILKIIILSLTCHYWLLLLHCIILDT